MNRNTEAHFSELPKVDISRSKLKRPFDHKTTMNAGDLVPIYLDQDILPGDTVSINMASLVRMTTPIYPVMDNAWIDTYFFFVPNRLVWNHWAEFWGENNTTHWEQPVEYTIPQITAPAGGWKKGTLADYMGVPTEVPNLSISALPFRGYAKIWNDWFRDENLKDPCMVNLDETTVVGTNGGDYTINTQLGAAPCKAAKAHDYFTSALPAPQKGPAVTIPLGTMAPVTTGASDNWTTGNHPGMRFRNSQGGAAVNGNLQVSNGDAIAVTASGNYIANVAPSNLYADLSTAIAATVNQLRTAFQIQKFYERSARYGSRYIEFIRAHFGVTSSDARLQRSEYLGGKRVPINITSVAQTSSTDAISPQGNMAAFSCTIDSDEMFTYSAQEHGMLIGLAVVRTDHTYQQGLDRGWSRKKWTDFYVPEFANLGEMPIYNRQIYAQGNATDDEVFGYQEAFAEYRYMPNRVSGAFRSNYAQPLDSWHYADYYTSQPILSSGWIDETTANIDRTLTVQSETEDQFIGDFYFDTTYVRPMPVYSIPGLLDHH